MVNTEITSQERLFRTNTPQKYLFHYRGMECKSRKSRDTWSNRHIWPWSTKLNRSKANRVLPREHTLESLLDCKDIQPVHPKGNQSWIFIGRTDAAETPILWPPDAKNWLIWKDPDAGKDWRQEEKGMREDEMVVWHHWLNGHEFA